MIKCVLEPELCGSRKCPKGFWFKPFFPLKNICLPRPPPLPLRICIPSMGWLYGYCVEEYILFKIKSDNEQRYLHLHTFMIFLKEEYLLEQKITINYYNILFHIVYLSGSQMVVTDISDKDGKNIKYIVFEQRNLILHKRIKLITDQLIR